MYNTSKCVVIHAVLFVLHLCVCGHAADCFVVWFPGPLHFRFRYSVLADFRAQAHERRFCGAMFV